MERTEDSIAEPEYFGTARVTSLAHPDCAASVGGDEVTLEASGYRPAAEVIVSLQLVGGDPTVVARVTADDDGTVWVPLTLPDAAPEAVGGFEAIGEAPNGLLLNEALLVFGDADACDTPP
jgi:hypothetical protein